jgi:hypothetical protein
MSSYFLGQDFGRVDVSSGKRVLSFVLFVCPLVSVRLLQDGYERNFVLRKFVEDLQVLLK